MADQPSQSAEFTKFYEAHLRAAYAAAARRIGPTVAEDIVAEAFALAWRKQIAQLEFQRGRAWLLTTVFNLCRNEIRAEHRARVRQEELGESLSRASPSTSPEMPAEFDTAWAHMSPDDQELFSLVYHDDLPLADVAVALGITEQATRTRLSRARSRFRTHFLMFKTRSASFAKEA